MKDFLEYLNEASKRVKKKHGKKQPAIIVDVLPKHGNHSRDKSEHIHTTPTNKLAEEFKVPGYLDSTTQTEQPPAQVAEDPEAKVHDHFFDTYSPNAHLGEKPRIHGGNDAVHKLLHFHHDYEGLNNNSRNALDRYTIGSSSLNRELLNRAGVYSDNTVNENFNDRIDHLDSVFKDVNNRLPFKLHVFHGAGFNPNDYAKQHDERVLQIPSYYSNSIDKRLARNFTDPIKLTSEDSKLYKSSYARHIIHTELDPGQPGFYIGEHSNHCEEQEYLLPRNTQLKIAKTPHVLWPNSKAKNKAIDERPGPSPIFIWRAKPVTGY